MIAPVASAWNESRPDLLFAAAPLAVLLVAPIVLTLILRARVLRGERDPAERWFRFMGPTQLISAGLWLAWPSCVYLFGAHRILGHALVRAGSLLTSASLLALYLVPPAIVGIVLAAISHPVSNRLRGTSWTLREAVGQAVWRTATLVVPFFLLILALISFQLLQPRAGVALLVAAIASRVILGMLQTRALGLEPHAVSTGVLRDRVFALAAKAGVPLRQLYVVPMARARLANAFAVRGNVVVLTDYLLANLSQREVDAVLAHELGHLKRRHPLLLALVVAGTTVAATVGLPGLAPALGLPATVVVAIAVFLLVSRHCEREADADAVRLTGDPEAMISGLGKVSRLNGMPLHWGKVAEVLLTHPSATQRAAAIGARAGIAPERIAELLRSGGDVPTGATAAPDRRAIDPGAARDPGATTDPAAASARGGIDVGAASAPYRLPVEAGRLFSTPFRARQVAGIAWTLLGLQVLAPALMLALSRALGGDGVDRRALFALSAVVTISFSLLAVDFLSVRPFAVPRKIMLGRLAKRGLDPSGADASFVGLSPGTLARIYEGVYDWDIGVVFLRGDRLCYLGEETRFSLTREQVTEMRLAPGPPGWIRAARIEVRWRDGTPGIRGAFTIRPAAASRLSRVGADSRRLAERLLAWREGAVAAAPIQPSLASLEPPSSGEVTGRSPRELARVRSLVPAVLLSALAAGGACVLLGLPLNPARGPGWIDLVGVGMLVQVFFRIPYWRWKEPAGTDEEAGMKRAA